MQLSLQFLQELIHFTKEFFLTEWIPTIIKNKTFFKHVLRSYKRNINNQNSYLFFSYNSVGTLAQCPILKSCAFVSSSREEP